MWVSDKKQINKKCKFPKIENSVLSLMHRLVGTSNHKLHSVLQMKTITRVSKEYYSQYQHSLQNCLNLLVNDL